MTTEPPDPTIQPPPASPPPASPPPAGPPLGGPSPGPPPHAAPPPDQGYLPPDPAYLPPAPPLTEQYGYGQPGTAVVTPGFYIDPASGLQIPDGTQLASVGRRIGAWFLAIPLAVVTLGIGYIIWGLIVWGSGTTPALQVLGMRCWRPEDGRVPGWWWMALREVVGRLAEGILSLITLITSFVLMVATKERKSLHDLIAGTVVLHDPDKVLASRM